MSGDWRNEPASEKQKEKLRFFGCTWDEGITKGQASDALDECARQFPEKNNEYYNRPATEEQLAKLREYLKEDDEEPEDYANEGEPLTYGQAMDLIRDCEMAKRKEDEEKEIADLEADETRIDEEWMRIDMDRREDFLTIANQSPQQMPKVIPLSPETRSQTQASKEAPRSVTEAKRLLETKLLELNADGVCDQNDENELKALAVRLGFNESLATDLLKEKFAAEFLPIQRRMEKAHVLTDEDVDAIERLKKKYAIELTLEGNASVFRSIYIIESKKQLPAPISTDLMLNAGETAYHSIPTKWHQLHAEKPRATDDVISTEAYVKAMNTVEKVSRNPGSATKEELLEAQGVLEKLTANPSLAPTGQQTASHGEGFEPHFVVREIADDPDLEPLWKGMEGSSWKRT